MKKSALKYLMLMGLLAISLMSRAQDLEYKMEVGAQLGGSFYLGDANFSKLFKETSAMGGLMAPELEAFLFMNRMW